MVKHPTDGKAQTYKRVLKKDKLNFIRLGELEFLNLKELHKLNLNHKTMYKYCLTDK